MKTDFTKDEVVFISDTHFDHANIIRYCSRPFDFPDVSVMNQRMLEGMIEADEAGKVIIHMGDFTFGDRFLKHCGWRPKGEHIIVLGNHDKHADGALESLYRTFFRYIVGSYRTWREHTLGITVDGTRILLSHEPQKNMPGYSLNIYGHHHNNIFTKPEYFTKDYPWLFGSERHRNVGVELTNYKPVTLEKVYDLPIPKVSQKV